MFFGSGSSEHGNGPNLMGYAFAEQSGYKMPSFFGACGHAAVFLGPVFVAMTRIARV